MFWRGYIIIHGTKLLPTLVNPFTHTITLSCPQNKYTLTFNLLVIHAYFLSINLLKLLIYIDHTFKSYRGRDYRFKCLRTFTSLQNQTIIYPQFFLLFLSLSYFPVFSFQLPLLCSLFLAFHFLFFLFLTFQIILVMCILNQGYFC